jgi:hypothetical protein
MACAVELVKLFNNVGTLDSQPETGWCTVNGTDSSQPAVQSTHTRQHCVP